MYQYCYLCKTNKGNLGNTFFPIVYSIPLNPFYVLTPIGLNQTIRVDICIALILGCNVNNCYKGKTLFISLVQYL